MNSKSPSVRAPGRLAAVAAALSAAGGWLALMTLFVAAYREPAGAWTFLSCAVLLVVAALAWLIPDPALRRGMDRIGVCRAVLGAGIVAGLAVAAAPAMQRLWLLIIAAALLGLFGRVVASGPVGRRLRPAIAAAAISLIGSVVAVLVGGPGTSARLYFLAGGLIIAGAVCAFAARWSPTPVAFGRTQGGRTPPVWATAAVLAAAGAAASTSAVGATTAGAARAGGALALLVLLCGASLGFVTARRMMPGLSRPRLISLCLISVGVLVIAIGVVPDITAVAVLCAAVGWLAGTAAAAHDGGSHGTRSVSFAGIGAVLALLLAAAGLGGRIVAGTHTAWRFTTADGALLILGVAAVVLGLVALAVLDPRRLQGLTDEIANAWKPAGDTDTAAVAARRDARLAGTDASETGESGGANAETDLLGRGTRRGLFIALEGGDGAGKSTQAEAVSTWLTERFGAPVILTHEPGGTPTGRKLREVLLADDGVPQRVEALLFAADRGHHVETLIRPALRDGKVVITDRYMDSSIAYQGAGRAGDPARISDLSRWATSGLVPDLTVVLDVDPAVAAGRRGAPQDHLEKEPGEFHRRVRREFLSLAAAQPERYAVVDAGGDPADVTSRIIEALRPLAEAADLAEIAGAATEPGNTEQGSTEQGSAEPASSEQGSREQGGREQSPERFDAEPGYPDRAESERAESGDADSAEADDARTRYLPADPTAAETVVQPASPASAEPEPAASPGYLERLRSQADAERRARERLRRQRGGDR